SGLLYYIVFLFSTTVHEAAHAWAAKLGGDLTAYHGGQVSLDPRPHIQREPFGMVILPLLSTLVSGWPFGFASAPYDPQWALRHPRRAGWMALAGPASNLLLVVISIGIIRVGTMTGVFYPPDSAGFGELVGTAKDGLWPGLGAFISIVFSMNLVMACLNMFPLPPLDGSGVALLFMSESTAMRYQMLLWGTPMFSMLGMLVAWRVFDVVFFPVFWVFVGTLYPGVSYG
ncbi:MAG TPA: site-2 protease family protein, partial [Vicinamibacterales bacterium]|nr:site-2 protease family protein [Vicinamibacterales bacterium]